MKQPPEAGAPASGRREGGGFLAVTARPAVRARVEAASEMLSLPAPVFVDDIMEALERGIDRAVLLLDLGSCCRQEELVTLLRVWAAFHPSSEIVVFTPLVDREAELHVAVSLVAGLRSAVVRVLSASDFFRDESWRNLWVMRERAALQAEIRADLLATIGGRPLAAATAVLGLLADAAAGASEGACDDAFVRSADVARVRVRQRKNVWQQLRRSGQLPPSWLLLVFRVLWYAKLREDGWSAPRIASFLGFTSPRHFRLNVSRRLGIGLRSLRTFSYGSVLAWAAKILTTPHERLRTTSLRALADQLHGAELRPPADELRLLPSSVRDKHLDGLSDTH